MPNGVTYPSPNVAKISREAVVNYLKNGTTSLLSRLFNADMHLDFSDIDLSDIPNIQKFFDTNSGSEKFSDTNFSNANFSKNILNRAILNGNMENAIFSDSSLQSAMLRGNFTQTIFTKANLTAAIISGNIAQANFSNANLTKSFCRGNDHAYKTNFTEANLTEADFSFSNYSGAIFKNADLIKTDLFSCNLANADFTKANLLETNLGFSNLYGADFTNVKNLNKIKDFRGAVFINVKGLKPKQLDILKEKGAITSIEQLQELVNDDAKWQEYKDKHEIYSCIYGNKDSRRTELNNILLSIVPYVSPEKQFTRELRTLSVLQSKADGHNFFAQLSPHIMLKIAECLAKDRFDKMVEIPKHIRPTQEQIEAPQAEVKRTSLRKKMHDLKSNVKNKFHIKSKDTEQEAISEEKPSLRKPAQKRKYLLDENGKNIESSEESTSEKNIRRSSFSANSSFSDLVKKSGSRELQ